MSFPPPELMVMKFVAELNGSFGTRLRVFTTGSSNYLFELVGACPPLQWPVAKADLKPEIRSALAHGVGHAPRRRQS